MESDKALYTLILDPNKKKHPKHPPLIMETDVSLATLKNMRGLKRRMDDGGEFTAKIAQVQISLLDNVHPKHISAALLLPDDNRVDKLLEDMVDPFFELSRLEEKTPWEGQKEGLHAKLRLTVLQWIRTL